MAIFCFLFIAGLAIGSVLPNDPLISAAEYYFEKNQYDDSLKLWGELSRRYPSNISVLRRLVDHQFLLLGRVKARETLVSAMRQPGISPEQALSLQDKLNDLNARFISDDGQSSYLQGVAKSRHGEFAKAEKLLEFASRAENVNTTVLNELVRCQAAQGAWDRYTASLQQLFSLNPFDWKLRLNLAEALIFQAQPAQALATLGSPSEIPRSVPHQVAYAAALFDSGDRNRSIAIFTEVVKHHETVHPIAWYYLGTLGNPNLAEHSRLYIQRFQRAAKKLKPAAGGFDPYRTSERLQQIEATRGDLSLKRS